MAEIEAEIETGMQKENGKYMAVLARTETRDIEVEEWIRDGQEP